MWKRICDFISDAKNTNMLIRKRGEEIVIISLPPRINKIFQTLFLTVYDCFVVVFAGSKKKENSEHILD